MDLGISAFVISGTLAVIGLTLHFTWNPDGESNEPPGQGLLAPVVLPEGAVCLGLNWSF